MLRGLLVCAALILAACSNDAATHKVTKMTEKTGDKGAGEAEKPSVQPFEAMASYGGRIHLSMSGESDSKVIRTQAELDAFMASVPKFKVQKGPGNVPNPDPLLTAPPIDFGRHMILAAVCDSFYCKISIEGHVQEGDTTVVLLRSGGEPDGAEMAQRPINMDGGDSVGNYKGIKVPRVAGKVVFRVLR